MAYLLGVRLGSDGLQPSCRRGSAASDRATKGALKELGECRNEIARTLFPSRKNDMSREHNVILLRHNVISRGQSGATLGERIAQLGVDLSHFSEQMQIGRHHHSGT